MLELRNDDMFALLAVRLDQSLDGKVVRFGTARGKIDLFRLYIDKSCGFGPGLLDSVFRLPADIVQVLGVPELVREIRQHCLEHLRMDRRRGRMIEIHFSHVNMLPSLQQRASFSVSERAARVVDAADR